MDTALRDRFIGLWNKHFGAEELPICAYYAAEPAGPAPAPSSGWSCLVAQLARARKGQTICMDHDSIGCFGGRRYLGYSETIRPGFEYFLSCGIEGKMEGERYKASPQTVLDYMAGQRYFKARAKYMVFKRWDKLEGPDQPEIVIFLARPDVLAGLFTLANFDETDANAVIAPFGAGCGSILQYPYLESEKERPRSVIGMFDVSARPFVPAGTLSFATPMSKFARMIDNMDASFLTTKSWAKLRGRIESTRSAGQDAS